MAFFSDLARAIAASEGMDEMAVIGIGQYLRKAGLISKNGRGTSAAVMTLRDAANLLIAVNGTGAAKDAVSAVEGFRALRPAGRAFGARTPWSTIAAGRETFGTVLERLIDASRADETGTSPVERELRMATTRAFSRAELERLEQRGIPFEPAYLEVELRRPATRAEIRTVSPYYHPEADEIHFAESSAQAFFDAEQAGLASDRRDFTIITERTLRSVATVLRA